MFSSAEPDYRTDRMNIVFSCPFKSQVDFENPLTMQFFCGSWTNLFCIQYFQILFRVFWSVPLTRLSYSEFINGNTFLLLRPQCRSHSWCTLSKFDREKIITKRNHSNIKSALVLRCFNIWFYKKLSNYCIHFFNLFMNRYKGKLSTFTLI